MTDSSATRNLILVLGDQLDADSAAFDGFDASVDRVWMAEVDAEAEHVWSSKPRIVMFLAAMRHFRDGLLERGIPIDYTTLDDPANRHSLSAELERCVRQRRPKRLIVVRPGEYRVLADLRDTACRLGVTLDVRPDRSFFSTPADFDRFAEGRKSLRLEYFYRQMRKRLSLLVDEGKPVGGRWNYDRDNREHFAKTGPGEIDVRSFPPDDITREVIDLVETRFAEHPGRLDHFDWPVTPADAAAALADFIDHRLAKFGPFEDAMWTGRPYLYHSRLSAALNLKLLDPREAVDAAVQAYADGRAPLNSVEGFVRQLIGWREFVRGVYWRFMPDYLDRNALEADAPLPEFYWTGQTDAQCLAETIGQTLAHGYAHHIQRLMVTGLFAMLFGVDPRRVHQWYLAVYVDAVEWVELPNSLGMSQFADGGIMASKPYAASGKYINRMSNYCRTCRYDPACATGEQACPFTTLYWDFLLRHQQRLSTNARMGLQLRNLGRLDRQQRKAIEHAAMHIRDMSVTSSR